MKFTVSIGTVINNGNRTGGATEWTISDDREAGFRFVNHEYNY